MFLHIAHHTYKVLGAGANIEVLGLNPFVLPSLPLLTDPVSLD